jgi:hypothetical protein
MCERFWTLPAGDERAWWKQTGIDPIKVARSLWKKSRANDLRIKPDTIAQATESSLPLP